MSTVMPPDQHTRTPATAETFWRFIIALVVIVFGGLALWSIIAPISGAVIAGGQIVVESNRKIVQHLEGGVVRELMAREGDLVGQGDVVAKLDDTVQRANLALIDSQLTELYARRARLQAERDQRPALAKPEGIEDIIDGAAFTKKLNGQARLFTARRATRETQMSLLNERIVQQNERKNGLRAQIRSLRAQESLIADELHSMRELHQRGYVPVTRLRPLERDAKRMTGEQGALRAGVAEAESLIAEAKLEMERLREAGREEAITELRDTELSINELEERRITAVDSLARTELRAPQAGRVINLAVHTVGGVVGPGAPLMEIVPDGDRLQAAVRVSPQDIDIVRSGQETLVRFSAFGLRHTPETMGDVHTVSADTLIDDISGISYYRVLVDLPEDGELREILDGAQLVPGMPVEAFIRTGSQSAISYLLKPLSDALARSMRED